MPDTITDEFAGQGGSYLVDPKTGRRTLVERTSEPATPAAPVEPAAPADADAQE